MTDTTGWCSKKIKVRVPATSANVGAGFDCLGFAVNLYSEMELELMSNDLIEFTIEGQGAKEISANKSNIILTSIQKFLSCLKMPEVQNIHGMKIHMKNSIPLSRGLGSSAAAIVSGIFAANECLDKPMSRTELLNLATEIEGHPDNVSPALNGNFTVNVMKSVDGKISVDSVNFRPRINLQYIVVIPKFKLATKKARAVLPQQITREDAIFNISRVAMLISSLTTGKIDFLSEAFDDRIHQPYRINLIPGMSNVFTAAKSAGAIGACLSGAGPSLIAFTPAKLHNSKTIAKAMYDEFLKAGIKSHTKILNLDSHGAVVI